MKDVIELTKSSQRMLKGMEKWAPRTVEAQALSLVDLSEVLLDLVKATAPTIKGEKYADDLKVVLVEGDPVLAGVIHPGVVRTVTDVSDERNQLVYVVPRKKSQAPTQSGGSRPRSDKWVVILSLYNPWPSNMLPVKITTEAKLVSRKVSEAEINRRVLKLKGQAPEIEERLRGSGLRNVSIGQDSSALEGSEVQEDLAFSVLRTEFGYNEPQRAHWRPALRALVSQLDPVQKAFVKFVIEGKGTGFGVGAQDITAGDAAQLERDGFGDRVGKAIGLKK